MEISEAFVAERITEAGAVLSADEAEEVQEWVKARSNERITSFLAEIAANGGRTQLTADDVEEIWMELCIHSFMAGVTYALEGGAEAVSIQMSPSEAQLFIKWLMERTQ